MIARRIAVVTAILLAFAAPLLLAAGAPGAVQAGQPTGAGGSDLGFGSWKFTGKDKSGVVWTGTLVIEKLDADQFDPQKYIAQGNLRIESRRRKREGGQPSDPIRSRNARFHDGSGIGLWRVGLYRRSLAGRETPDQGRLEGDRTVVRREGKTGRQRGGMVGGADREVIPACG